MCLFRYDNPLSPLGQHISSELGLTKRHFFEIPSPHCNLDLDEYEYEDDYEWCLLLKRFLTSLLSTARSQKQSSDSRVSGGIAPSQEIRRFVSCRTGHTLHQTGSETQNQKTEHLEGSDVLRRYHTWLTGNVNHSLRHSRSRRWFFTL